jgi:DNA-binding response OmpR family regulator
VVDDDATVADVVVAYLERAGFETAHAPDVVVLDLMLPGIDGLEVCRRLRRRQPDLPVIMLTARGEAEDRILGLEVGADDYVTKPFSPRELVLRVQSVLRRAAPGTRPGAVGAAVGAAGGSPEPMPSLLVDGDLALDPVAHRVQRGGAELPLTGREFDLLAWFLAHPGQAFGREELMRSVWGWEFGDQSTVTVHVRRLREKVEADPSHPTRLVTVFGVGYRWDRAPSAPKPPASPPAHEGDADAAPEAPGIPLGPASPHRGTHP